MADPDLAALAATEWRGRLPTLLDECVEQWSLVVGEPYASANASLAARADLPDGTPAVLKIGLPHRESEHEADALAYWGGAGAVLLLARDDERQALLIERCVPGEPLSKLGGDAALAVLIELLPRLWKPARAPFRPLADEAAWWREYLPAQWDRMGRPYERRLLDAALEALDELPRTQGEEVLLHQDLHGDNVLSAEREPWLVIDPKPLVGEREFAVAPIVRSRELGHGAKVVRERFRRLTSELDLDAERARGWTIAQTLAWADETTSRLESHIETARWVLDA